MVGVETYVIIVAAMPTATATAISTINTTANSNSFGFVGDVRRDRCKAHYSRTRTTGR